GTSSSATAAGSRWSRARPERGSWSGSPARPPRVRARSRLGAMHLVASIRLASDLDAAITALEASAAMTRAEARMRLAPEPPALLVRLPVDDAIRVVAELERAGLPSLDLDEDVPSDSDRFQVRSFAFEQGSGQFISRIGETIAVPWDDVRL